MRTLTKHGKSGCYLNGFVGSMAIKSDNKWKCIFEIGFWYTNRHTDILKPAKSFSTQVHVVFEFLSACEQFCGNVCYEKSRKKCSFCILNEIYAS